MIFKVKDHVMNETNGQEMVVFEINEKIWCRWIDDSRELKKVGFSEYELEHVNPDNPQLPLPQNKFEEGNRVSHITNGNVPMRVIKINEKDLECAWTIRNSDRKVEIFFHEELELSDGVPYFGYISRPDDDDDF